MRWRVWTKRGFREKPHIFASRKRARQHWSGCMNSIREGKNSPYLVIGVPVGFVNVVQSKELIMDAEVPYIVAKRKKRREQYCGVYCKCTALYD